MSDEYRYTPLEEKAHRVINRWLAEHTGKGWTVDTGFCRGAQEKIFQEPIHPSKDVIFSPAHDVTNPVSHTIVGGQVFTPESAIESARLKRGEANVHLNMLIADTAATLNGKGIACSVKTAAIDAGGVRGVNALAVDSTYPGFASRLDRLEQEQPHAEPQTPPDSATDAQTTTSSLLHRLRSGKGGNLQR